VAVLRDTNIPFMDDIDELATDFLESGVGSGHVEDIVGPSVMSVTPKTESKCLTTCLRRLEMKLSIADRLLSPQHVDLAHFDIS
jgi:hypothetical protein